MIQADKKAKKNKGWRTLAHALFDVVQRSERHGPQGINMLFQLHSTLIKSLRDKGSERHLIQRSLREKIGHRQAGRFAHAPLARTHPTQQLLVSRKEGVNKIANKWTGHKSWKQLNM